MSWDSGRLATELPSHRSTDAQPARTAGLSSPAVVMVVRLTRAYTSPAPLGFHREMTMHVILIAAITAAILTLCYVGVWGR